MASFNGKDDYLEISEIPKGILRYLKIWPVALPEWYVLQLYLRHKHWYGRLQNEVEYRIVKWIFRR